MAGQTENLNDTNVVAVPSSSAATSSLNDPNVVPVGPQGLSGIDTGGGNDTERDHEADVLHVNPNDSGLMRFGKEAVNLVPNVAANVGGAAIKTVTGTDAWARQHLPPWFTNSNFGFGKPADIPGETKYTEPVGSPASQLMGYGGESLMEFLAGDEALKGLSLGKRLEAMSGLTKLLEQSPRTMNAVRMGATVAKILTDAGVNTAQASTLVGLQTFLRGEGAKKALSDAIHTAEIAGPFSVAASTAAEGASYLGKGAESYQRVSDLAKNAEPKEEVVQSMSNRLKAAEKQMHDEYESGFQNIAERTQGQTIPSTHTPLATAAREALGNPINETDPFMSSIMRKGGNKLNPEVQELLTELSTGVSADEQKAFEDAQRTAGRPVPTGIIGADGQPITRAAEAPTAPTPHDYTGDQLVKIRQKIRALSDQFDYGDVNSRVLRSLISSYGDRISPLDQTLGQLAGQTHDEGLVNDYMQMRKMYMEKHSAFDNPVIDKLRDGKVGDAAKDFVNITRSGAATPTTGKAYLNLRDLRTLIGDDGVKAFGQQVRGTIMRDSVTPKGDFDPDKFIYTMSRFDPDTLAQLMDVTDVNNGMAALMADAKSAATIQKLVRGGVLSGFGVVGGAFPHVGLGTLIGMTAGEGGGMGGIAKGRELLDWVALHPNTWKLFRGAGKLATSPTAGKVASSVRYGAGEGFSGLMNQAQADQDEQDKENQKDVYNGLSSSLGGPQ
jgi:hypothetical protein